MGSSESFADDLNKKLGIVSAFESSLALRSAEVQPMFCRLNESVAAELVRLGRGDGEACFFVSSLGARWLGCGEFVWLRETLGDSLLR